MKALKNIFLKSTFLLLLLFCLGLQTTNLYSQITKIPGIHFEQALINLGIDSDGVINGQVLTSDIETVIVLDLFNHTVLDLTGLEDFAALEYLDVSNSELWDLDVSNNIQLKELYFESQQGGFNNMFTSLDLSNNVNLEILVGTNMILLEELNLKSGNNSILWWVVLPCEFEGESCEFDYLNCIIVDDEEAANNDEPPYSSWYIAADFIYSEDCILGIQSQNDKIFSVYPNPVKNELILSSSKNNIGNLKAQIYTIEGKIIQSQNLIFEKQATINVSSFSKGIYFISIQNESGQREVLQFLKE